MKILVLLFLAVIVYCLGSALASLVREKNPADARNMLRALSWRIALSLALFVLLLVSWQLGWVHPHGIQT